MTAEQEIWKPVKGFELYYMVSNIGRVKSLDRVSIAKSNSTQLRRGKILKPYNHRGYDSVLLFKNKKAVRRTIHRLVALAFIPNPDNLPIVNHKDEIKNNNRVENLEWCTQEYNLNYKGAKKRLSESMTNNKKLSNKVYQYDKDFKLINIWPSTREIERSIENANSGNIVKCCKGLRSSHLGFKWSYNKI